MPDKKRLFLVEIQDRDGEEQTYQEEFGMQATLWDVARYIQIQMVTKGDYYGHTADMTIKLEITELVNLN
jgi:hypothetical protein